MGCELETGQESRFEEFRGIEDSRVQNSTEQFCPQDLHEGACSVGCVFCFLPSSGPNDKK